MKQARRQAEQANLPDDLEQQVRDYLTANPSRAWDDAIDELEASINGEGSA